MGFLDLAIDDCNSTLLSNLKFGQALCFFLNVLFLEELLSLLSFLNELILVDGDRMLFDELLFSDLFGPFQFLLD